MNKKHNLALLFTVITLFLSMAMTSVSVSADTSSQSTQISVGQELISGGDFSTNAAADYISVYRNYGTRAIAEPIDDQAYLVYTGLTANGQKLYMEGENPDGFIAGEKYVLKLKWRQKNSNWGDVLPNPRVIIKIEDGDTGALKIFSDTGAPRAASGNSVNWPYTKSDGSAKVGLNMDLLASSNYDRYTTEWQTAEIVYIIGDYAARNYYVADGTAGEDVNFQISLAVCYNGSGGISSAFTGDIEIDDVNFYKYDDVNKENLISGTNGEVIDFAYGHIPTSFSVDEGGATNLGGVVGSIDGMYLSLSQKTSLSRTSYEKEIPLIPGVYEISVDAKLHDIITNQTGDAAGLTGVRLRTVFSNHNNVSYLEEPTDERLMLMQSATPYGAYETRVDSATGDTGIYVALIGPAWSTLKAQFTVTAPTTLQSLGLTYNGVEGASHNLTRNNLVAWDIDNLSLKLIEVPNCTHNYVLSYIDEEHHGNKCSVCHAVQELLEHNYGDGVETLTETCTTNGKMTYTCTCGASYDEVIPATGHTWDEGTITTEPTLTATGVRTYTCEVCDATNTETLPVLVSFAGTTVMFGNAIDFDFIIEKNKLGTVSNDEYYAVITKTAADGTQVSVTVSSSKWTVYATAYWNIEYFGLSPKEMTDTVGCRIFKADGTPFSENKTDSVVAYAMRAFDGSNNNALRTLLIDMLNYGAASQIYFNYNTANLANAGLTATHLAYATEGTVPLLNDDYQQILNVYGANLELDNRLEYIMYFSGITEDMLDECYATVSFTNYRGTYKEFTIDGNDFIRFNDTVYGVYPNQLVTADVDVAVTIKVYMDDGTLIGHGVDSISSYLSRAQASLGGLTQSVMKFAMSVRAYLLG